ncbi:MAG: LytTR family DNA-binding domain-containing protein [Bacteroidales bacterium]|nr:LytTR family DNA-binding domain-containing protein [Bacteroidales bacterium]
MIRAIVVDDEPLARALIESHIKKTPFLEVVGSYPDAMEALEAIRSGNVDVAFLDIQMPDMNGLELSKLINGTSTKVVFITAFNQYALEGFKVDAVDYLLKPVTFVDFYRAAERARDRVETERTAKRVNEMSAPAPVASSKEPDPKLTSIFIKSEYKMLQVDFDDIRYIEGAKDYVIIHTEDGQRLMTQITMKTMEEQLPGDTFMRVHKSYIVNLAKVREIEHNCIVFGKNLVPVSESYKIAFYNALRSKSLI